MKPILLLLSALVLTAQPTLSRGDVLLIDPATERPYMWLHADTGRMELLPPYQPEQAYRLLLEREQAAWDAYSAYAARTYIDPREAPRPKAGR